MSRSERRALDALLKFLYKSIERDEWCSHCAESEQGYELDDEVERLKKFAKEHADSMGWRPGK